MRYQPLPLGLGRQFRLAYGWFYASGPQEAGTLALVWHSGRLHKKEVYFSSLSIGLSHSRGTAQLKKNWGVWAPLDGAPK